MPRKNPVSATDLAIGKRLAQLRMDAQLSREELAARAGELSAGVIARVELGRMPLRYVDAKKLLRALSPGARFEPDLRPINPLWLAEGIEPERVDWPLILPKNHHLGVDPSASFSNAIQLHRALIMRLVQDPAQVTLPESWLPAYCSHWDILHVKAYGFQRDATIVERLLRTSAEKLASASSLARSILDDYRATLAEVALLRCREAEKRAERKLLSDVTKSRNIAGMKSHLAFLRIRLARTTAGRGDKAKLAKFLRVPAPRVSEWLRGDIDPSGETCLKLLYWVEEQEAKQTTGSGGGDTPPEPKIQSKASNEKKPQSGQNKH
jgi:transcriptional regulator with XRE-family HTH domain